MRYFTIPEAAKFVGVNVKTMRKHVKEGRIESVDTPLGVKVAEEALLAYAPLCTTLDQAASDQDTPEVTIVDHQAHTRSDHHEPDQAVPLAAHLAALEFAERRLVEERERFELAQRQWEDARLRAEQAERSRMTMEFQLQKYQSVLAENAESLAEERAFRKQAEAKLQEMVNLVPLPEVAVQDLKVAMPARKGWGQRVRGWFGLKEAQR